MANPYNSKWFSKPKKLFSANPKILAIKRHMQSRNTQFHEYSTITIVTPTDTVYIAKNSQKFRLKSHLDWAYYTPKTLAQALDNLDVAVYYEQQLKHQLSDPNIWSDWDEEQDLKSYYAARAGRASLI